LEEWYFWDLNSPCAYSLEEHLGDPFWDTAWSLELGCNHAVMGLGDTQSSEINPMRYDFLTTSLA